jgi:hypothetical protein
VLWLCDLRGVLSTIGGAKSAEVMVAETQVFKSHRWLAWIPAYAGMTGTSKWSCEDDVSINLEEIIRVDVEGDANVAFQFGNFGFPGAQITL